MEDSSYYGENIRVSVSVSQEQRQGEAGPGGTQLGRRLLRLWIEQRLQQIRDPGAGAGVGAVSSCPPVYRSGPQSELVCGLWAELVALQTAQGLARPGAGARPVRCPHSLDTACRLWCAVGSYTGLQCTACPHQVSRARSGAKHCR